MINSTYEIYFLVLIIIIEITLFYTIWRMCSAQFICCENVLFFNEDEKCVYFGRECILTLRSSSMNHRFVKYLFENINREISEKELEENVFFRPVYINKLVSNLKFPADVRDSVFTIGNGTIIFSPIGIKKSPLNH
ncbi:hypothetical protein GNP80_00190 [Aliivibrio fischeri]|uniref:hypothetical protein n=1 Tax=Aliivibrio fischeri TaxID=668 RepID=UPI0012D9FEF6|nr:hypothetical protein [Aliivibrio fischeri]MUK90873.1 hypothetical protein [Aliivibrio fischeri]